MASAQKYMQLLNNPNARRMLDLIASAEGVKHGYNTLFGNQRFDDLSGHPNIRKAFTQTDGKKNYTTAAGRYQFLNDTWNGLSRQYGLRDFSPQSQDIGAIALLDQIGALPYVLKGDFGTAIKKSGGTWASLPSSNYAQNKRSWNFINKQLGGATSQVPARLETGNWSELAAESKRIPALKWNDLAGEAERAPIGNWSDLVNGG
ncbi:glycoside hydrolase family 24 protein [Acinetobacter baumannii]|uniref:glycoside hydrolase family 24 protein n=1 Tax=Acinetobacter baumannii TaxID=470 RepID=UPI001D0F4832|nr:glycoside hydrolase family 104 protein [Acinetobacter baumannii]